MFVCLFVCFCVESCDKNGGEVAIDYQVAANAVIKSTLSKLRNFNVSDRKLRPIRDGSNYDIAIGVN